MNGIEALENWYNTEQPKPVEYCFHYNIIKKELKVLQILKKKEVDIKLISTLIHKAIEVWKVDVKSAVMEFTIRYNVGKNIPLTLAEMELIVELLTEE